MCITSGSSRATLDIADGNKVPPSLLLCMLSTPSSQPFPHHMPQDPEPLGDTLQGSLLNAPGFVVLGSAEQDTAFQKWCHDCCSEVKGPFTGPPGEHFPEHSLPRGCTADSCAAKTPSSSSTKLLPSQLAPTHLTAQGYHRVLDAAF